MDINSTAIIITLGSFIAAYVNAVFATGGYFIMLAVCTSLLPMTIAIPIQPALIYTSLIARVGYFKAHTNWHIVLTFCVGAVIGVFIGAKTFIQLSESILSLAVGIMIVVIVWLPKTGFRIQIKYPYFTVGILHAFLTTAIGASAVLQTIILRSPLLKLQITGTLAACFLAMEGMRIIGYASVGFDYTEFLTLIIMSSLAGIAGTWIGKRTEHLISEKLFRVVFKWLITFVALRLLYKGVIAL
jgi:uncharacterized membrane protein YfcA